MRRTLMVLAVLVFTTEAMAWESGNTSVQECDAAGEGITSVGKRVVSTEATPPPVAPTVTETNETTDITPSTEPAAPVDPSSEEKQENSGVPTPQSQLDLEGLEERIRQTDALGFFTKLSLKNQVDDLLDRFRVYHKGRSDLTIEQLHERYTLLLLKLASLLAEEDAQLSRDIFTSRGAIWNMLADPEQFAKLQ